MDRRKFCAISAGAIAATVAGSTTAKANAVRVSDLQAFSSGKLDLRKCGSWKQTLEAAMVLCDDCSREKYVLCLSPFPFDSMSEFYLFVSDWKRKASVRLRTPRIRKDFLAAQHSSKDSRPTVRFSDTLAYEFDRPNVTVAIRKGFKNESRIIDDCEAKFRDGLRVFLI